MKLFSENHTIDQWGPIDSRVLYPSFWFRATGMIVHGVKWPLCIGEFKHDRTTFYWEREVIERYGLSAIEKWILPTKKRRQIWREYRHLVDELSRDISEMHNVKNFDERTIKRLTKKWYYNIVDFWRNTLVCETANFGGPAYLDSELQRDGIAADEREKIVEQLLTPDRLSFHQQCELELLKVYFSPKKNWPKLLRRFSRKWHWLDNSYYETGYIGIKGWEKRLSDLNKTRAQQRLKTLENYQVQVRKRKKAIIKKYDLSQRYLSMSAALSFSLWWQDDRKAKSWQSFSALQPLLTAMAHRYRVPFVDLLYYTAENWLELGTIGKKLSRVNLHKRKRHFIFIITRGQYKLFFGKQADRIIARIKRQQAQEQVKTLRGVVAFQNKRDITGRVRIILSPRQTKKLDKDDILVAPMTSPDYIHLMRQAKAIVTDVGGLMSHAAIVARELEKTCVIGTKVATSRLRNGQTISISAQTGEISIIKR